MGEHILIFCPDRKVQALYTAALREFGGVTRSFVLTDMDLVTNVTGETVQRREEKQTMRNSLAQLKVIAAPLGIRHQSLLVDPVTLGKVTEVVLAIHDAYPDARFSFVIAGSPAAPVALGLFKMALWLSADLYLATEKIVLEKVSVPRVSADEFRANPNYLHILTLLHGKTGTKDGKPSGITRQDLFQSMKDMYAPVRETNGKGRHRELSHGNFSQLMTVLEERGLVAGQFVPGSSKLRLYSITPDGEIAFRLFSARPL